MSSRVLYDPCLTSDATLLGPHQSYSRTTVQETSWKKETLSPVDNDLGPYNLPACPRTGSGPTLSVGLRPLTTQ